MRIATLDMESFWDVGHTLSKMSPVEYIMHKDTELISCSIKIDKYPTDVFFGEPAIRKALHSLDWSDTAVLAHNVAFDGLILNWRLGIKPRMYMCTAAMARPLHGKTCGVSLAKLVEHYQVGVKNNAVLMQTKGKHLADFTPEELEAMKVYNREDTDQCYALFNKMRPHFSAQELWQIDAITRMRVEPMFEVDVPMLETALSIERDQKRKHILQVARKIRTTPGFESSAAIMEAFTMETLEEAVRVELASAPKFAALLGACGVEVPMKPSPSNPEKQVPALAKTDEEFTALQDHDDPIVAAATRARLAVKSTLLETRIEKLLTAASLAGGKLPVPIRYCGADTTGRDSGEEYNLQNLPRVTPGKPKTSDALRNCMKAPKGYKVIVSDLSGIEMRVNHFLWKVESSMELFQNDVEADLYKDFASARYGIPVEEVDKTQRQMGKVCLLEGTLVLTDRGEVPIEQVTASDKVWDGLEWSNTLGPIYKGVRHVITYDGITATPDHEVWVDDGRKVYLRDARAQSLRLARTGAGGTPLGFGAVGVEGDYAGVRIPGSHGAVYWLSESALRKLRQLEEGENAGLSELPSEVWGTPVATPENGSRSPALHQSERPELQAVRSQGDTVPVLDRSRSGCVGGGEPRVTPRAGDRSEGQQRALRTGESSVVHEEAERREPGAITEAGFPPIPADVPRGTVRGQHSEPDDREADSRTDTETVGEAVGQTEGRVWDLLNCGPEHRFTANGRLVSNCHLGLGFGAGAPTFKRFAKVQYGMEISEEESVVIVSEWREKYAAIVQGWKLSGMGYLAAYKGQTATVDPWGMVTSCPEGLRLPSGRIIRYPELRMEEDGHWPDGRPKRSMFYAHGRHKARITGPKACENIVQALARDIIFDDALLFYKSTGLRPQLRVHDELVYVVPDKEAEPMLAELQRIMRTPPKWWDSLVVWSEGDIAQTYGAAK